MRGSIFIVLVGWGDCFRGYISAFVLSAFLLIALLYTSVVFPASESVSSKAGWAVCMPFEKVANSQRNITSVALEREFKNFASPEKKDVEKERAAYLLLSKSMMYPNGSSIESWQWNSLKVTVDKVFAGEIVAKEFMADVNNNGSLEYVVEFRSPPPFTRAWNFVLDKNGKFHQDFFARTGIPEAIIGEFRVFKGEVYIFDISNPVFKSESGRFGSLPFVIYKPRKSAMMKDSGISRYGVGPLCEFEVIHEQETVR